jgi:hypothetical protein
MYYKLKNTLAGLAVAVALLGVSFVAGRPPITASPHLQGSAPSMQSDVDGANLSHKHSLRRSLSMPYFSFGPLLPRRES